MGTEQFGPYRAARAAEDLRTKQYHAVVLDSDGEIQLASSGTGIGILADKPNEGEYGTYQISDGAKWVAAGAMNAGIYLTSDANGRAIPASAGDERLAFLKEPATAAGHVVSVEIVHAGQDNA